MAKWSNVKVTQVTYSEYRAYRGGSKWDVMVKARAMSELESMLLYWQLKHSEAKGKRKSRLRATLHHLRKLILMVETEAIHYGEWRETKQHYDETQEIRLPNWEKK